MGQVGNVQQIIFMKTILRIPHLLLLNLLVSIASAAEWQILFDGSSLDGWKHAEENQKSARIEDGVLVLNGERCHLYWVGVDGKASFQNFEAEIVFQTEKNANSGLFFHTQWQANRVLSEKNGVCPACSS